MSDTTNIDQDGNLARERIEEAANEDAVQPSPVTKVIDAVLESDSETTDSETADSETADSETTDSDDEDEVCFEGIIEETLHKFRDAQEIAHDVIPLTAKRYMQSIDTFHKQAKEVQEIWESTTDEKTRASVANQLAELRLNRVRIQNSRLPITLAKSVFLNLFSDFDSFTGSLLQLVFLEKNELLASLEKNITIKDVMKFSSIDEIKVSVINDWIDTHRRDGYVAQFTQLEKRLGFKTLRDFDNWPAFVELTQRRNILMHCDGCVTKQYIDVCKKEKVKGIEKVELGSILEIEPDYLHNAIDILSEVVVKLTHCIWRKHFSEELENADQNLNSIVFEYLMENDWKKAETTADFGTKTKTSNDLYNKLFVINQAIACKFSGKKQKLKSLLNKMDFSSSILDFRLAEAVLRDDFKAASSIMEKIGKSGGEMVNRDGYHHWPLFKEFRNSKEFLQTYRKIYGYSFSSEILKDIKKEEDKETTDGKQEEVKA